LTPLTDRNVPPAPTMGGRGLTEGRVKNKPTQARLA
jgi:hypothetical protein